MLIPGHCCVCCTSPCCDVEDTSDDLLQPMALWKLQNLPGNLHSVSQKNIYVYMVWDYRIIQFYKKKRN